MGQTVPTLLRRLRFHRARGRSSVHVTVAMSASPGLHRAPRAAGRAEVGTRSRETRVRRRCTASCAGMAAARTRERRPVPVGPGPWRRRRRVASGRRTTPAAPPSADRRRLAEELSPLRPGERIEPTVTDHMMRPNVQRPGQFTVELTPVVVERSGTERHRRPRPTSS